jgi:hypothetical protein
LFTVFQRDGFEKVPSKGYSHERNKPCHHLGLYSFLEIKKESARKYGNPLYEGSEENHQHGIG